METNTHPVSEHNDKRQMPRQFCRYRCHSPKSQRDSEEVCRKMWQPNTTNHVHCKSEPKCVHTEAFDLFEAFQDKTHEACRVCQISKSIREGHYRPTKKPLTKRQWHSEMLTSLATIDNNTTPARAADPSSIRNTLLKPASWSFGSAARI